MPIYLIRHTTPAIATGVCYGQTDVNVSSDFEQDFAALLPLVASQKINKIYSSPLQRSYKLAEKLSTALNLPLLKDERLKELNYGLWEMERWENIHPTELNIWMANFVNLRTPSGESYIQMHKRVSGFLNSNDLRDSLIISHSGVMRSILSSLTKTPLNDAYKKFKFNYNEMFEVDLLKRSCNRLEKTRQLK
ncbi:MAG: alpha-ribazole phosphatase family protein [Bacteroidetes bacterium]|nr:alpha-ribazole phosphatase family protein [Bacteroidota bacterium]